MYNTVPKQLLSQAACLCALVLALLTTQSNNGFADTRTASILIATWPGFAPAFVAKEKHFFGNLNTDIKVVDDFSARRTAFKSGQAYFTIYTVDSLAFDVAAGIEGVPFSL